MGSVRWFALTFLLAIPAGAHSKNDKAAPAENADELGALLQQADQPPPAPAEEPAPAPDQQVRSVRISSAGRRAVVFVVPADRISSEEAARVTMRAQLSGLSKPGVREVKFVVEPAD